MFAAPDVSAGFVDALVALGRSMMDRRDGNAAPMVLSVRPGGVAVRVGDVVVKAHAVGTDARALASRLRVATDPLLRSVLLPPICVWPKRVRHRLVTMWPAGEPVRPDDPDAAPWSQAARLHATPVDAVIGTGRQLPAGGPSRLLRAMARLRAARASSSKREVLAAFATLPSAVHDGAGNNLVHGDWRLGQIVRWRDGPEAGAGHWRLIDVDDLGIGDPAWDLARPAAWYAAGLLPSELWLRFLDSYRASGGARGAGGRRSLAGARCAGTRPRYPVRGAGGGHSRPRRRRCTLHRRGARRSMATMAATATRASRACCFPRDGATGR